MRKSLAVVLAAFVLVVGACGGDDDDDTAADAPDTTDEVTSDTGSETSGDVSTCVEFADVLPEGAPEVPIQVGDAPTELVIEDIVEGDGAEVAADATVTVDYIGVSCSTGLIFDDSYSRGEPATFPLNQVIPGWSEGLVGMKVGGTRLLGIPSEMAYGAQGRPPAIAPNEALWFVVEMHEAA